MDAQTEPPITGFRVDQGIDYGRQERFAYLAYGSMITGFKRAVDPAISMEVRLQ